jgi:hypothetical protein
VQAPVIEIIHGVVDRIQGIALGAEGDLAAGVQGHEFGQVVIGADEVTDEVDLGWR